VTGVQTCALPIFQQSGWTNVRVIDIPDNTQVIAVKAIDTAGVS